MQVRLEEANEYYVWGTALAPCSLLQAVQGLAGCATQRAEELLALGSAFLGGEDRCAQNAQPLSIS